MQGGTSTTLTIPNVPVEGNGISFRAVFTNSAGTATSNPVTLTVLATSLPVVTSQPQSQSAYSGGTLTFTAAATGAPPPTVTWQYSVNKGGSWAPLSGWNSSTEATGALTAFENGWEIRAVFANAAGTTASDPATITVISPVAPVVTAQPQSQTAFSGRTLTFTAAASGTPSPTVSWQVSVDKGSTWITAGVTTTTFTSGTLTSFENGWEVRAVFSNMAGTTPTNAAVISVVPSGLSWNSPTAITAGVAFAVSSVGACPSKLPNGSPLPGPVVIQISVVQTAGGGQGLTLLHANANGSWSGSETFPANSAKAGSWEIEAECQALNGPTGVAIAQYAPHPVSIS